MSSYFCLYSKAALWYLVVKVFILKLVPIDALSSGSILIRKISTLDHKFLDDLRGTKINTNDYLSMITE